MVRNNKSSEIKEDHRALGRCIDQVIRATLANPMFAFADLLRPNVEKPASVLTCRLSGSLHSKYQCYQLNWSLVVEVEAVAA